MANSIILEGFKSLFKANQNKESSKTLFEQLNSLNEEEIESTKHPEDCTCKDCKEKKSMDEFLDADIDLALDASGQSVGIAGGTGSTGGFNSTNNSLNPLKKEEDLGLGAGIALAGAGIGAGLVGSKIFDGYDRKATERKLHEILDKLDEASMSPEDEHDSALIKSALDKIEKRSNARFTPEEQAVLDKYGIKRNNWEKTLYAGNRPVSSEIDGESRYASYDWRDRRRIKDGDPEKINYADRARKMPQRDANQVRRDNRVTNSHTRGSNLLDTERAMTGYEMGQDYRDMQNLIRNRNWDQHEMDKAAEKRDVRLSQAKAEYDKKVADADSWYKYDTEDRAKSIKYKQNKINDIFSKRQARKDARLAAKNEAYSVKEICWIDDNGIFGNPGEKLYKHDIIDYWKENKDSDPVLAEYDGDFTAWLHDTLGQMTQCEDRYEAGLVKQEACNRKANKKKPIKEGTNPRENTDRLFELIDNGIVDAYDAAMCLADWMSDDEVGECMYTNEIFYDNEDMEESLNEEDKSTSVEGIKYETYYYDGTEIPDDIKPYIKKVIVKDGVKSIENSAFSNCSKLTSITIPDSVTSIGEWVFFRCRSLKSITIPDSVTSIGEYAFGDCSGLTNITIGNGVMYIEYGTFVDCTKLRSIIFGNSVTSIERMAFQGCTSLPEITFPDSIAYIGNWAFADCTALTSITIPDSVESIKDSAFSGCSNLKNVYYKGTKEQADSIDIGDVYTELLNATWHYRSTDSESLKEDTVKTSKGKWVNKGDTGKTHGEFNTKKEADAQRRAIFAQGWKK